MTIFINKSANIYIQGCQLLYVHCHHLDWLTQQAESYSEFLLPVVQVPWCADVLRDFICLCVELLCFCVVWSSQWLSFFVLHVTTLDLHDALPVHTVLHDQIYPLFPLLHDILPCILCKPWIYGVRLSCMASICCFFVLHDDRNTQMDVRITPLRYL